MVSGFLENELSDDVQGVQGVRSDSSAEKLTAHCNSQILL